MAGGSQPEPSPLAVPAAVRDAHTRFTTLLYLPESNMSLLRVRAPALAPRASCNRQPEGLGLVFYQIR